jgi:DNA replication protein DnaC
MGWAAIGDISTLGGNRADPKYAELTEDEFWMTAPSNGERLELPPILALQRKRQHERERRIRVLYSVGDNIDCVFCEDTGRAKTRDREEDQLDFAGQPCNFCATGERTGEQQKRAGQWTQMIPDRFKNYTSDGCPNETLVMKLYEWAGRDPIRTGMGATIIGEPGRAKTGAAVGIMRDLHSQGHSCLFKNTQDLLDEIKQTFDSRDDAHTKPLAKAERATVLLLDDLGAEHITDWGATTINQLLRKRYDDLKPTIITTNMTSEQFDRQMNERIMSRLRESSEFIYTSGRDYRSGDR